jgi:type IV pilus assembly protein PilB
MKEETDSHPAEGPRFGRLLQLHSVISENQLQSALRAQSALDRYRPIGQILLDQGALTRRQLASLLDRFQKRSRLGEVLVRSGLLTEEELTFGLTQTKDGTRLGDVLLKLNLVAETAMRQALGLQLNVPFLDLDSLAVDRTLVTRINKAYATRYRVIPVAKTGNRLTVATDNPGAFEVFDELEGAIGCGIDVVSASEEAFLRAFERLYRGERQSAHRLELISVADAGPDKPSYTPDARQADDIVRQLIMMGIEARASDIHLETRESRIHARFRIDGVLQTLELGSLEEALKGHPREVISRIKILGNADIAERRRPQDGSFRVRRAEDDQFTGLNLRVSVIPGYFGENVVLRILDPHHAPRSVDRLGFSPPVVKRFRQMLGRPAGMILLTGPTGSGKTTTLHAALMAVYRPGIKILTAEDPIEYVYEQFIQAEVDDRIGNTFAAYLRAFLRHDPEVIMIGEIRDHETAAMAFRAAQTGHLLLSTLHTTQAVGAVSRLLDLGVDRNLITSSLLGVMGQRLIRMVCPECRVPCEPAGELVAEVFGERLPPDIQFARGRGCPRCNLTGYQGRTAVGELWTPTEQDIHLINKGAPFDELRRSAGGNTISMAEDVTERLCAGQTTLEELMRSLPYASIAQFRELASRGPRRFASAHVGGNGVQ